MTENNDNPTAWLSTVNDISRHSEKDITELLVKTYSNFVNDYSSVIKAINENYKDNHTKTEYFFYTAGKKCSRFFKFMKSSQMKTFSLIVFWATFVAGWIMAAFAHGTLLGFVVFGLIILLYTNATIEAVSAIVKNTMFNYYSGSIVDV